MKNFRVKYYLNNDCSYTVEVEAKTESEVIDEICLLKWYYVKEEDGTMILNKDHVTEIHVTEIKGENS